jgi:integrase/recombinase XerD
MAKRKKNKVDFVEEVVVPEERIISLADAKVQFLRDVRGLAKQTQRWHKENLNALEKVLGMQSLVIDDCRKLTVPFLKDHFVFYMLEDLGLKVNTINGRIRSVRGLIQFLHRENYLPRDYSADLPVLKAEKVIIQAFSEEEIARLLRQPDQSTFTGLRDYTVMLLLLETGMRISELVGIQMADVHIRDGNVLVHGKGSKQRLVPIQSKMRQALQKYTKERGNALTDALFVTIDNEPIAIGTIQKLIKQYGEQARIANVRVSPHTFRHTMAKYYILAGGDIFSLQRILGHSSMETVRIYVEMFSHDVNLQHSKFSFVEHRLS